MPAASPDLQHAAATSSADAQAFALHFEQIMEALLDVVEEETRLVRAGRLKDAGKLEQPKADLARLYLADAAKMKSVGPAMRERTPQLLDGLRRRHDLFRSLLQINLTVLATAHAVAEGLVRGVSDELARKAAPSTYGPSGRTMPPPISAAQPLAVSRRL